jgi:RNA polymerase sigma-70 factor (ECF subfamily)
MSSCVISSSLPDEDLVRHCRQGEDNAFTLLYDRYRRRVLLTAYRVIRNPEDARDATQEIFLKAYLSLRQWNSAKSKLSTWLYRLAANHAIDCWRAQRRRIRTETRKEFSTESAQLDLVPDAGHGPDRELERKEQADEFRRCVEALPVLQKKLFILRHYQGLSLMEIAHREGRSLGTVKGSLYRASRFVGRRFCRAVSSSWHL